MERVNHPFRKRTCPPTDGGAQVPYLNGANKEE